MSGNIKKIGTLLVVLAFFASVLAVSVPVGADGSRVVDVFVSEIQVSSGTPTVGDNITITATIQAVDENCTAVTVTFEAVNGTDTIGLMVLNLADNVTNATPYQAIGWWNSDDVIPNADLVYTLKVTVEQTGDTNATNDTLLQGTVDWKAPKLGIDAMAGDDTALIGDDYTLTVTVKNNGDAAFDGVQQIKVYKDGMGTEKGMAELNCTATALAAAGTKTVDVVINTTTFTAGEYNFTAGLNGFDAFKLVTFAAKTPNIFVDSVELVYTTPIKHTQVINITAVLKNDGTADGTATAKFFNGDTEIGEMADVDVAMGTTGVDVWYEWTTPASMASVEYLLWVKVGTEGKNATVTVAPQPHTVLAVSSIVFNPTALVALDDVGMTQDVTVTVTVANTGDLDAVGETVTLKVDGTTVATNTTVDIAKAGTTVVTFTYVATTKEDAVELNFSAELGTASIYELLALPGDIDLAEFNITEFTITPATQQERGLSVDMKVKVKNIGDALAEKITLKIMAGTTEIGTADLVNLTAGGEGNQTDTITWNIPMTFATGEVTLNATIDGYPDVFKNMTYTIIEYKKPVVTVAFAKNKKDKVINYAGEAEEGAKKTMKIKLVLTNDGTADAKNVDVVLKDKKGNELGNSTGLTVTAGGTLDVEIQVKVKAGTSTTVSATVSYDGIHDDAQTPVTSTENPKLSVEKTPGFELVLLVGAVAVALVVLSRRRK